MIEIKGKNLNYNKVVSLEYATSEKNGKHYLIVLLDVLNEKANKMFFEVKDEAEYKEIIASVKNQIN